MFSITNNLPVSHNIGHEGLPLIDQSLLSDAAKALLETSVFKFDKANTAEEWVAFRSGSDSLSRESDRASAELIRSVEETTLGGCRALELIPNSYRDNEHKVILFVHGGCLTLGTPEHQIHLPAPVADKTGWKVISIDYPLAPYAEGSGPHPAHTATLNAYRALLEEHQYNASDIVFLGDSAGGGIAFGVALMARDEGLPLPGAIVAYEPWIDMDQNKTAAYSNQPLIDDALVLSPINLASARDVAFGKQDSYSPYVSPANGTYEGFSSVAVAIYTAGKDLLWQEGKNLAQQLTDQARAVEYHCTPGMWHGFQQSYGLPESEESATKAAQFLLHYVK